MLMRTNKKSLKGKRSLKQITVLHSIDFRYYWILGQQAKSFWNSKLALKVVIFSFFKVKHYLLSLDPIEHAKTAIFYALFFIQRKQKIADSRILCSYCSKDAVSVKNFSLKQLIFECLSRSFAINTSRKKNIMRNRKPSFHSGNIWMVHWAFSKQDIPICKLGNLQVKEHFANLN